MPRLSRIGWPPRNLKTSSMIEKLGDVVHRLTHAQTHVESLASVETPVSVFAPK
jgi:hypothetical protein